MDIITYLDQDVNSLSFMNSFSTADYISFLFRNRWGGGEEGGKGGKGKGEKRGGRDMALHRTPPSACWNKSQSAFSPSPFPPFPFSFFSPFSSLQALTFHCFPLLRRANFSSVLFILCQSFGVTGGGGYRAD